MARHIHGLVKNVCLFRPKKKMYQSSHFFQFGCISWILNATSIVGKKVADIFPLDGNLVVINPIMGISKSFKKSPLSNFKTRYIKPKWYFGDDVSTPWKFNIAPENDGWKMSFLLRLPISRGYVKFSGCIMKRFTIIFNNSKMFKIPLSPKCRMKSVKPWCRVLSNQDTSPIYSRNSPYQPGCWVESWLNGEPSWRKIPSIHPRSLTWPLKMVVERLLSYWEDNVSGAMLNFRVVDFWLGHVGRMLVLKVLPRKSKKCPLKNSA